MLNSELKKIANEVRKENIEGAKDVGIDGFLVDDMTKFRNTLDELLAM